jgi:hypothetical protein
MGASRRIDRSLSAKLCRFFPYVNGPLAIFFRRAMMGMQEMSA